MQTNNLDFYEITLYSDLARDLKVKGHILMDDTESTGTGTSTYMAIYLTSGGNFALYKVYKTQWQGSSNKYLSKIVKSTKDFIGFFGLGDQAKYLYKRFNETQFCIENNIDVDYTISEDKFLENGNPAQEHQDLNEFDNY